MYITDACNSMKDEGKRYQIMPEGRAPTHAHYYVDASGKLVYQGDPTGHRPDTNPPQDAEVTLAMILSGDWTEITQETKDYFGIEDAEPAPPPPAPPAEPAEQPPA